MQWSICTAQALQKQADCLITTDSHLTLLRSILALILLISFHCRALWIFLFGGKFPSSDMLKTPVASLKTSSCVSCLAASVARQTSSNAFEIWVQQKYFLLASLPQHHPPKSVLPIMISWKSTAAQNLFVCSSKNAFRFCVLVIVCACVPARSMFVAYWLPLLCGEMRMDQYEEGGTEDNTQTVRVAKRMKDTQNELHISLRQEERFI